MCNYQQWTPINVTIFFIRENSILKQINAYERGSSTVIVSLDSLQVKGPIVNYFTCGFERNTDLHKWEKNNHNSQDNHSKLKICIFTITLNYSLRRNSGYFHLHLHLHWREQANLDQLVQQHFQGDHYCTVSEKSNEQLDVASYC